MAAIGAARAAKLIDAARQAGMTDDQITAAVRDTGYSAENMSEKAARHFRDVVDEHARRVAASVASPRQIDYILALLRQRGGDAMAQGGFMNGPTDRDGIARLSRRDASAYIDSLKGNY